jgi:hypothetical protein
MLHPCSLTESNSKFKVILGFSYSAKLSELDLGA